MKGKTIKRTWDDITEEEHRSILSLKIGGWSQEVFRKCIEYATKEPKQEFWVYWDHESDKYASFSPIDPGKQYFTSDKSRIPSHINIQKVGWLVKDWKKLKDMGCLE